MSNKTIKDTNYWTGNKTNPRKQTWGMVNLTKRLCVIQPMSLLSMILQIDSNKPCCICVASSLVSLGSPHANNHSPISSIAFL